MPRDSGSSGRRVQMKTSLKKSLPLLHQRSRIPPPHHLPQGNLLSLVFTMPPIGHNILPLSVIRCWTFMMAWNHPPIMFLWLTLLLLTHCLRYIHGFGMAMISVLWYHRIRMSLPSKMAGSTKSFLTSTYSYTVSLSNG